MSKTGYVNGSDLLIKVGGKYVGHATTHTTTFNSETKDRAVKPVGTAAISAGLWKEKGVVGLSISISVSGLRCYDETEGGYKTLVDSWKKGATVEVEAVERKDVDAATVQPYLVGNFVISSLEEQAPAADDATYSCNLENSGQPKTFTPANITGEELTD